MDPIESSLEEPRKDEYDSPCQLGFYQAYEDDAVFAGVVEVVGAVVDGDNDLSPT